LHFSHLGFPSSYAPTTRLRRAYNDFLIRALRGPLFKNPMSGERSAK